MKYLEWTNLQTERFKVTRGWGKGEMGSFLLNGCRVFGRGYEKVVEIDCGSACTTLCISLLPLKYMLKNGRNGKFCYTQTCTHSQKKSPNIAPGDHKICKSC